MSPTARIAAGTFLIVVLAFYFQTQAVDRAEQAFKPVAQFTPIIKDVRARIARSRQADLYAPGERLGFLILGPNPPTDPAGFYAFQYAFLPATLTQNPNEDRVVVFSNPEYTRGFEKTNSVRLLEAFREDFRVYQREKQSP
jgi:hypothetical protein